METLLQFLKSILPMFFANQQASTSHQAITSATTEIKKADAQITQAPAPPVKVGPNVAVKPKFVLPAQPLITSLFGNRTIFGKKQWHPGIDFAVSGGYGTPIKACEAGTVIMNKQSTTPDKLTFVAIRGDISGCYLYYCHIGSKENTVSPLVSAGQHVECGQIIGYANSTGMTTGPHLHVGCYTRSWVSVDFGLFLKKFAPELFAQLINYRCTGELDPSNKTGRPEADL